MIMSPLTTIIACTCVFMLIQCLAPKVTAIRRSSNIDEFTVENQRTRKKQNYMVHRNKDILRQRNNNGPVMYTEPFDPDSNPEELSAFIVDYANMIRNDVILLDNSVETRTRKRGNIKVEKYNQAIPNSPCSCEYRKENKDLGENFYPRFIEIRNCSSVQQRSCPPPYICKESLYNLIILQRRRSSNQGTLGDTPEDLRYGWVAEEHPVSVGCVCTRDYII